MTSSYLAGMGVGLFALYRDASSSGLSCSIRHHSPFFQANNPNPLAIPSIPPTTCLPYSGSSNPMSPVLSLSSWRIHSRMGFWSIGASSCPGTIVTFLPACLDLSHWAYRCATEDSFSGTQWSSRSFIPWAYPCSLHQSIAERF